MRTPLNLPREEFSKFKELGEKAQNFSPWTEEEYLHAHYIVDFLEETEIAPHKAWDKRNDVITRLAHHFLDYLRPQYKEFNNKPKRI